jgi:predicted transcriptional regulator
MRKGKKTVRMYLVSLCREHLVAWPAVALFRQVAQDQQLLPRKQGLLFAAKTRKGEKKAPSRVELCEVSSFALSGACLGK